MITFKEFSLSGGWKVEVRKSGVHVGTIRRATADSPYAYYKGKDNQLTVSLRNASLDELKKAIEKDS
ncbi:hypothetical protein D3C77_189530 [compost metagenome]|nr:conserved protein of unknown function [Pseudomonas sp. JV241A]